MLDQEIRKYGIGASEVAAVLGLDDRRDAHMVWLEKKGLYQRDPPTSRMILGKKFERAIVDYYSDLTGRETRFMDRTVRHPAFAWMLCTPDAVCAHELRGIEAKYVSWDQHETYGETPDQIPVRVQLQAVWSNMILDFERWDVVAVVGSNAEPRVYTFERDEELEAVVFEGVARFNLDNLEGNVPPPIGASEATTAWLRQRYPRNRTALREATAEEVAILEDYAQVRAEEKELLRHKNRLENTLKLAVGEADGLYWERGRFTWKCTKDGTTVDWEAIAGAFMRAYTDEERAAVVAEFTSPRPGARRLDFRCKEAE